MKTLKYKEPGKKAYSLRNISLPPVEGESTLVEVEVVQEADIVQAIP